MKKPIIGIVGRVKVLEKSEIFIYDEYRKAIIQSGGIPILLLPIYCEDISDISPFQENKNQVNLEMIYPLVDLCDGILFPGGSKWYGFEQEIYRYAYKKDKPIFGICLGMQMIACAPYFNQECSDCTSPIVSDTLHNQNSKYVHDITFRDSMLKKILGVETLRVNSRHSFGILENDSFFVSSYSSDGVIESIEIPSKSFILGVQWHPESIFDYDIYAKKLFRAFILACKK